MNTSQTNDSEQQAVSHAKQVKEKHETALMNMPNVVGIALGYKQVKGQRRKTLSLVILVSKKVPETLLSETDLLPKEIDGVPVDVVEIGNIKPGQSM